LYVFFYREITCQALSTCYFEVAGCSENGLHDIAVKTIT